MQAQHVCNLLDTISKPPWNKPLNWNLHVSRTGEGRFPFHIHIQYNTRRNRTSSPPQCSLFPEFARLPPELQLRILAFCSGPTLWQAMRASSALRTEAAKFFWADEDTYYLIESRWLLAGGYPGITCYDLSFARHVQNVEVEYDAMKADDQIAPRVEMAPLVDAVMEVRHHVVRDFWETLTNRFPSAKRVIINQSWESFPERLNGHSFPLCLDALIRSSPSTINVLGFVVEKEDPNDVTINSASDRWKRALYQPTRDGEWRNAGPKPVRNAVFMPVKAFNGPVGRLARMKHVCGSIWLRKNALGSLIVEYIDRHHFGDGKSEPFSCLYPGCDAFFHKAGQWTLHVLRAHFQLVGEWTRGQRMSLLSEEASNEFRTYKRNLDVENSAWGSEWSSFHREWFRERNDGRMEMREGLIHQLENDEDWHMGQEVMKSDMWRRF